MIALAEYVDTLLQRGITALNSVLGKNAASTLLQPTALRAGEVASFIFPLPTDYTGTERRLRIVFPSDFPREQLRLHVEPSPWLVWPHAMKSGLCLHGFQERPVTGSPEAVVKDSLARLARIVSLSQMGSDTAKRDAEFQNEITSYWLLQNDRASQRLILLDRPRGASKLLALSDPRHILPSGKATIWLASNESSIKKHYHRVVGRRVTIRAPELPGFYVKLQSFPDLQVPKPTELIQWLTPHLSKDDNLQLLAWFHEHHYLTDRWVVLELPGDVGAPIYCLNVRSPSIQADRGTRFGLRSSRRLAKTVTNLPTVIRSTSLEILDRAAIHSRDLSGIAQSLENSRIVFVGAGSLGGSVAMQLARSGVGQMTLIDPDTLTSANLGRHVLGADDLGLSKALALRDKILKDLPTTEVTAYSSFAEDVMNAKPDLFEKADLVIVTTADWESEVALWSAKSSGATWRLLQAWSEPHTLVGHAILAPKGGFDARYMFDANGSFAFKYTEWPEGGVVPLPACGESFIPGGGLGMSNVASMVSQTALRALAGHHENAAWVTSIYRPEDAATLGGEYLGPQLPSGVIQNILERSWPEREDGGV